MKYKFKEGKLLRIPEELSAERYLQSEKQETKYCSASCNVSFTGSSSEDVTEQLLNYLKDSVKSGDLSPWFIIEE